MVNYHPYLAPEPGAWPYSCVECGHSSLNPIHRVLPPAATSTMDIARSIVDMSVVARVARGVEYLKATYPDALLRIDIDEVNIDDSGHCILGQLWGFYNKSFEFQVYPKSWHEVHGFRPIDGDDIEMQARHSALTAEWRNSLYEWMDERP